MTVVISNGSALNAPGVITVTELDGSPSAARVSTLKFSNNAVTDNGDGSVSVAVGTGTGTGDASTNTSVSVDGEVVLFSGTGGKTLKRSTLTGIIKVASGVQQVATPGTDFAPATTGTSILKGSGAGGFSNASAGTDYLAPAGNGSALTNMTKSQVGLGNVDNTSDVNKPVSTAQQTAFDLKAPILSPIFTGTVTIPSGASISGFAPLSGPSFTGGIGLLLQPSESFIIDARTNPRTITTTGVLRINHTAGTTATKPIALDINCAGFSDTHAISVNYIATNLGPGAENHGFDFSVDSDNSTGGEIAAVTVSTSGNGAVNVTAIEAYPGVDLIDQQVGVTSAADASFTYNTGAYTDRTVAFGSNGTNVQVFVANTDYIYIGHPIKFNVIEINLSVFATGLGIIPTFEYSTSGGGGWTTFTPGDTTNGFRQNGTVILPTLGSWATSTVNGVAAKYWVRIRRTNAAAITAPTENTIKIIISTFCSWDKYGKAKVSNLNVSSLGTYANNAAAIAGGLVVGDIYKTAGGSLNIVV